MRAIEMGARAEEYMVNFEPFMLLLRQKQSFSSLFLIAYKTGKVIDYPVLSKHSSGCKK